MIGLMILGIYLVGYLVAIPIIFRLLTHAYLSEKLKHAYNSKVELAVGDVINSAAGASVLALFWFLALPFIVSYGLRHARRPNARQIADRISDDFQHAEQLRVALESVKKELARETGVTDEYRPARIVRPTSR